MISKYVHDIAMQMNIPVSRVTTVEGSKVGCLNVHLLNISSKGKVVSTLMYQKEFDDLQSNVQSDRLEVKVRSALIRLQMQIQP